MFRPVLLLVGLLGCSPDDGDVVPRRTASATPTWPADAQAFRDVSVVDVEAGRLSPGRTVVVADGAIYAVLDGEAPVPDEVAIVAEGGYLLPGLADMHVHAWFESDLPLLLANGVTTVRNLSGDPLHLEWRASIEAGERLGPSLVTTGPIVDGSPPFWPGSDTAATFDEGRAVVRRQHRAGYDAIKVYNNLPAAAWEGVLDKAADLGMPVFGHVPFATTFDQVLDSDQRIVEHLDGMDLALLGLWLWEPHTLEEVEQAVERIPEGEVDALAARAAASGTVSCPTLTVLTRAMWRPEAREAFWASDEARFVHPSLRDSWAQVPTWSEDAWAGQERKLDEVFGWVRALHEAGAPLVVGTDMPNPFVTAGFAVHHELALLVDAGLTPAEALAAATVHAARALDAEEEWGAVAAGQRADLVWAAEDPLVDVSRIARPEGVMVRGQWLDRAALDSLLDDAVDSFGRAGPPPEGLRTGLAHAAGHRH